MKTIAIDFDGVIHAYSKGWHDGTIYDPPIVGAVFALTRIKTWGYRIVIYSARNYDRIIKGKIEKNQIKEMTEWLNHWKIPYDEIHTEPGKPLCVMFIDDRGYRFEGDWFKSIQEISKIV